MRPGGGPTAVEKWYEGAGHGSVDGASTLWWIVEVTDSASDEGAGGAAIEGESSAMYDAPQRLSVVLEHHEDDDEWAVVAILIDERGGRRRSTLGRFARRSDAARHLDEVYGALPKRRKPKG